MTKATIKKWLVSLTYISILSVLLPSISFGYLASVYLPDNTATLTFLMDKPSQDPVTGQLVHPQKFILYQDLIYQYVHFNGQSGPLGAVSSGYAKSGDYFSFTTVDYAIRLTDKLLFALDITHPFVSKTTFSGKSLVRYLSVISSDDSFDFAPGIAYQVNSFFAVAAGLDIEDFTAELDYMVPLFGMDLRFNNMLSDNGLGWHANASIHPAIGTFIGLSYYSKIRFHLQGMSSLTLFPSTIATADVTLPPSTKLDFYQALSQEWGILGGIIYTQWDTLKLILAQNTAVGNLGLPYFYRNTLSYELGARYAPKPWGFQLKANYSQVPNNPTITNATTVSHNYYAAVAEVSRDITKNVRATLGWAHQFAIHQHLTNNITNTGIVSNGSGTAGGEDIWVQMDVNV